MAYLKQLDAVKIWIFFWNENIMDNDNGKETKTILVSNDRVKMRRQWKIFYTFCHFRYSSWDFLFNWPLSHRMKIHFEWNSFKCLFVCVRRCSFLCNDDHWAVRNAFISRKIVFMISFIHCPVFDWHRTSLAFWNVTRPRGVINGNILTINNDLHIWKSH